MAVPLKIDVTTGDSITPGPVSYDYPLLFDGGKRSADVLPARDSTRREVRDGRLARRDQHEASRPLRHAPSLEDQGRQVRDSHAAGSAREHVRQARQLGGDGAVGRPVLDEVAAGGPALFFSRFSARTERSSFVAGSVYASTPHAKQLMCVAIITLKGIIATWLETTTYRR